MAVKFIARYSYIAEAMTIYNARSYVLSFLLSQFVPRMYSIDTCTCIYRSLKIMVTKANIMTFTQVMILASFVGHYLLLLATKYVCI